jgi:hypothetical protein
MYSPLNAQLIQANELQLASRQPIAEHRRALREERDVVASRRRHLKGLAVATSALEYITGVGERLGARCTQGAQSAANACFTHTVGQVGGQRFFKHR